MSNLENLDETASAVIHTLMKTKKIGVVRIAADAIRDRSPKTAAMLDAWAKLVTLFYRGDIELEPVLYIDAAIAALKIDYPGRGEFYPQFMGDGQMSVPVTRNGEFVWVTMNVDQLFTSWHANRL